VPEPLEAVVFDCDGLLVDTETAWTRAERVLYARRGHEFTVDHKRELLGTSGATARATIERHLGLPAGAGGALQQELHVLVLDEVAAYAPPMPGAVELVRALRARGTPIALASNSPREHVDLALETSGFAGSFAAVVTPEDVGLPKPAPDLYAEAVRRLGAAPAGAVALEDSPTGVASARAAGKFVIGVPSFPGVTLDAAHLVVASLDARGVHDALGLRLAA